MRTLAILDHDDIFQGLERVEKAPDPMPDNRVPVPHECDLVAGRFIWDRERRAFLPLSLRDAGAATSNKDGLAEEDAFYALARTIAALCQNQPPPPEARAWAARYLMSFDALMAPPQK